jgi:GxxExxY protein
LTLRKLSFERQVPLRLNYKGIELQSAYRLDIVVEGRVVVEIKATESILPVHRAQVLSYLRLAGIRVGLLINFHVPYVTQGIERFVL